jgi:hypothetical protein
MTCVLVSNFLGIWAWVVIKSLENYEKAYLKLKKFD